MAIKIVEKYLIFCFFFLTASAFSTQAKGQLATLKGESITVEVFKNELEALGRQAEMIKANPDLRLKFLEHLIDNRLLANEARKSEIEKSKIFQMRLSAAQRDILANLYVESHIREGTTDQALRTYFNSHRSEFSDKEVRASHILFDKKDKAKAEKILQQALSGVDFVSLAKKHSTGPSGPKGGDLNFFKKGRMVPAFDEVAFSTPKGKVHPKLVQTRFGLHIIKVTDIKGGGDVSFEDKKQQVKILRSKAIREEILASLRKENAVDIREHALSELKL